MTEGILHIAQDDKFINAAHYLFENAFPGKNDFVIVKPQANPPTRFISKDIELDARVICRSTDTKDKLVDLSSDYHVTVLHGLDKLKGAVFLNSLHKYRFMTIIYGAEIYNEQILGRSFLGKKSQELSAQVQRKTVYDYLKDIYRSIRYSKIEDIEDIDLSKVLYEMRVFGSLPGFPYNRYLTNGIYRPSLKKIPFSYYPIEFIIKDNSLRVRGRDILLGNSASPTNNHLEAFDILKNQNLDGRKIFTPLSYGRKRYAKAIIKEGKKIFRDNFEALTTFLPLEEYNKIISRCGIVIMNHYRPQAMGNIIASLYMGAKVFLHNTDAYQYLKGLGCNIFLIEKDLLVRRDVFQLLEDEQIENNRNILRDELSTSILVKNMRSSFGEIFGF